jgi:hypothetical protein
MKIIYGVCKTCNKRFQYDDCDETYDHYNCPNYINEVKPLDFINNFVGDSEDIRSKFRNGYCYYFAKMLQTTYNRGAVCLTAPFGHFVWFDSIDNKAYDIEGIYEMKDHDAYYLIPERYLGNFVNDFMPNRKGLIAATKSDIIHIIKTYCNDTGLKYYKELEKYLKD